MEILLDHLGKGMWLSLLLSMPAVLLAASIGLVVGILQAVTQVQEQTIAAAPKILGVFLLIIFGGGLMLNLLNDYVRESFYLAFTEVPQSGNFLLPPKPKTPGQIRVHGFFKDRSNYSSPGKAREFFSQPSSETLEDKGNSSPVLNGAQRSKPQPSVSEKLIMRGQEKQR